MLALRLAQVAVLQGQHLLADQSPSMAAQPKWILNGCADVAWLVAMGKTLTIKNLPEELHARLIAAAKRHRRSLNQQAIVCLESGLGAEVPSVEEELARIRTLRESLGPRSFDPDEIDAFKRDGRP
mgnify:CR=1 FL=1